MRKVSCPKLSISDVYQVCTDSISSEELKGRLNQISPNLVSSASSYLTNAKKADLYLTQVFNGDNNDIVAGQVTKKELKDLYTIHMVPSNKPARAFYDELKSSADLNICPFCGFGHVSTLDHYLPKAKYPLNSVLPYNLVPSCSDCNKGKSSSIANSKEGQSIHPYFDHGHFISDQWLFANVIRSKPALIKFEVQAPTTWHLTDKGRVEEHFRGFNLGVRYAVQAANELASLRGELQIYFDINGKEGVKSSLLNKAEGAKNQHVNSWKTAMYQALSEDDWYCDGGFSLE